jgi:exosortase
VSDDGAPEPAYQKSLNAARAFADQFAADPRAGTRELLPAGLSVVAFVLLFWQPMWLLMRDWWTLPEAGHGLLLAPVAVWMAWKAGVRSEAGPNYIVGGLILVFAVLLRYAAGLAAEMFTMRASVLFGLAGITIYHYGVRQVFHWWLPFLLGLFAIPLPELITQAIALPLQFKASQMGAALLSMREIPVRLSGNVIRIPGNELFVTEACSGLRSLTALISLSVLLGGLVLQKPISRLFLVVLAVPIAVAINGVRVFFTGFLVYFVDPALGKGFMHLTEGWLLFLVSLTAMGVVAWLCSISERFVIRRPGVANG